MNNKVNEIVSVIRTKTDFVPRVALTLGSGLGNFADNIKVVCEIPYNELPGFPVSTVAGHDGRFIMGYVGEVPVICMKGRVHYYEGYTMEQVVLPARVMHALGAEILFLTNAAGGTRDYWKPGQLCMIRDHIACFIQNPLIGPNDDDEGVRFPDMTAVYDKELQELLMRTARANDIPLDSGVYVQLTGPSFETPTEVRMIRMLGGDLVGMSTVVEAIVARHMGMRVCAVSLVSNLAAGISSVPLSHKDVSEAGEKAAPLFTKLVASAIEQMTE